ncbi:hypothetical protein SUGI_0031710 [Cryptomeria japonica]|nr:hypothetical protein SUGI_0031710 [Cryptomeria japonica]
MDFTLSKNQPSREGVVEDELDNGFLNAAKGKMNALIVLIVVPPSGDMMVPIQPWCKLEFLNTKPPANYMVNIGKGALGFSTKANGGCDKGFFGVKELKEKVGPVNAEETADKIYLSSIDLGNTENELTTKDLIQLVEEKELWKVEHKEISSMQEKVPQSYEEVENVMDRTRCEAEKFKTFTILSFAKRLLDVTNNWGRASAISKIIFSKLDASKYSNDVTTLLKLLGGVEMIGK